MQAANHFDTYRLKLFRELIDRKYEQILNKEDLRAYTHADRVYRMGFWACVASIPVNFYFGVQIGKQPKMAKTFMFRSLGYTTFSTFMFALGVYRWQALTKDLSARYLTNASNQELERQINETKGIYNFPGQQVYQTPNLYQ